MNVMMYGLHALHEANRVPCLQRCLSTQTATGAERTAGAPGRQILHFLPGSAAARPTRACTDLPLCCNMGHHSTIFAKRRASHGVTDLLRHVFTRDRTHIHVPASLRHGKHAGALLQVGPWVSTSFGRWVGVRVRVHSGETIWAGRSKHTPPLGGPRWKLDRVIKGEETWRALLRTRAMKITRSCTARNMR